MCRRSFRVVLATTAYIARRGAALSARAVCYGPLAGAVSSHTVSWDLLYVARRTVYILHSVFPRDGRSYGETETSTEGREASSLEVPVFHAARKTGNGDRPAPGVWQPGRPEGVRDDAEPSPRENVDRAVGEGGIGSEGSLSRGDGRRDRGVGRHPGRLLRGGAAKGPACSRGRWYWGRGWWRPRTSRPPCARQRPTRRRGPAECHPSSLQRAHRFRTGGPRRVTV